MSCRLVQISTAFLACLVVSLTAGADAWAQATAQISGSVTDQSGGSPAGCDGHRHADRTGVVRSSVTDETGSTCCRTCRSVPIAWRLPSPAFEPSCRPGSCCRSMPAPSSTSCLKSGQLEETRVGRGERGDGGDPQAGVSQVIENERILELPLNGRQVTDLVTLGGGAVQSRRVEQSEHAGRREDLGGGRPVVRRRLHARRRHAQQPVRRGEPSAAVSRRAAGD